MAVGRITEASLVVRVRDWHPQTQLLRVRGEHEIREYELSETAYEVIPLAALTIFALPPPSPAPATAAARIAATPSPTVSPRPTDAELLNAEVAALYTLHQLKADLGEQIEIVRKSNEQIVVRGQVETPQRKRELIAALAGIPFVAAQIQTFDEAMARSVTAPAQATTVPLSVTNNNPAPAAGVNLFERRLARYFAERGGAPPRAVSISRQIAQMANIAFTESSAALSSGWALRRLAERFDTEQDKQLSLEAAARLREVVNHHLTEISARSRNLRRLLEPALVSIAGTSTDAPASPQPAEEGRKARVMRLFKAIEQVQRLSYRLFSSERVFAATAEEAARMMLEALDQLDAACLALEQDNRR